MTLVDTTGTFASLIESAAERGTGCLHITDIQHTRSGRVYFKDGQVYAVHVDGFLPKIGTRLHTGGMLSDEHLAAVLAANGGDVFDPTIGDIVVERGYVSRDVINAVSQEVTLSAAGAIASWNQPQGTFKSGSITTDLTIAPVAVAAIIKALAKRREHWLALWNEIANGLDVNVAVPIKIRDHPAAATGEAPTEIGCILAVMDGVRTLDHVAGECGLTRFETGHVLRDLIADGYVVIKSATEAQALKQTPANGHHPAFAPDVLDAVVHAREETPDPSIPPAFDPDPAGLPDGTDVPGLAWAPEGTLPVAAPGISPEAEAAARAEADRLAAASYDAAQSDRDAAAARQAAALAEADRMALEAQRRQEREAREARVAQAEAALAELDREIAENDAALAVAAAALADAEARTRRVAQHLEDANNDRRRLGQVAGNARLAHQQMEQGYAVAVQEHAHFEEALRIAQARHEESANHVATIHRHVVEHEQRATQAVNDLARCGERITAHERELGEVEAASKEARNTSRQHEGTRNLLMDRRQQLAAEAAATRASLNELD